MDVVFDYDPALQSDPAAPARDQIQRLIGCYQQALGHELPNYLVALQGLARLLAAEHARHLDAEGLHLLQRIADLARTSDELARAVAAIGKTCRAAVSVEHVFLSDAAREAAAAVNSVLPGSGVEYDIQADMPDVMLPPSALHQLLVQLLSNAARAGMPGRPLHVKVRACKGPGGVEVSIADNGRGFAAEAVHRLGEPFAAGPGGGRGLGLFLVRQLLAGWGGALHVQSELGRGTVVTVLLREARPSEAPAESSGVDRAVSPTATALP